MRPPRNASATGPRHVEGHAPPPHLASILAKAADDLLDAAPEVTTMSVGFHLPDSDAALAVITTAEGIANDRGLSHFIHVHEDVYEVRFTRHGAKHG